jgi:hypothetical protein
MAVARVADRVVEPSQPIVCNDSIRPQQQPGRDGEAERFGRFEIDDEFKARGLVRVPLRLRST